MHRDGSASFDTQGREREDFILGLDAEEEEGRLKGGIGCVPGRNFSQRKQFVQGLAAVEVLRLSPVKKSPESKNRGPCEISLRMDTSLAPLIGGGGAC